MFSLSARLAVPIVACLLLAACLAPGPPAAGPGPTPNPSPLADPSPQQAPTAAAEPAPTQPADSVADCSAAYVEFALTSRPRVWVDIADDAETRRVGLMHREWLAEDAGMLFIFERPVRAAFWMKDTLIPLSIAFIDEEGTVLDIQDMQPLSLETHAPAQDYLYALETNAGWFAQHGVEPGTQARFCLG